MHSNDRQIVAFSFVQRKTCHRDFEFGHMINSPDVIEKITIENEIQILNKLLNSLKKRL